MSSGFKQVAIVGTGLIGTSLALALRARKSPPRIVGFDLNGDVRRGASGAKTAAGQRAFDHVGGNLAEALRGADLIVVSTPVRAMELLFQEIGELAAPGTIVTDTGGTKRQVLDWADANLPDTLQFVGGNPMASKVAAGPWDAEADLFANTTYCLCPLPRTDHKAVERVVKLVEELGAISYFVDVHEHDGLVARVSQLPYLVSVAVVNAVAEGSSWREAATLASGGFATASHLTECDPRVFADAGLTNREALLGQIDRFSAELAGLRARIADGDESLRVRFEAAQQHHREWLSGRASEGTESRPSLDTESLKPQSLFLGNRLGGLLRGKDAEKK